MEVESLAQELQGNINNTNMIQQQVSESLALLEDSVQQTVEHTELVRNLFTHYLHWFSIGGAYHVQINENATEINAAFEQAEEIYANATNSIQLVRELGMNNTARASDILTRVTDIANQAQESRNVSGWH